MNVLYLDSVNSTMDYARENVRHLEVSSFVCSRVQTCGRGQRQRSWESPDGGLWLSIVLSKGETELVPEPALICSTIADHVANRLQESFDLETRFKEPNDLYVGDSKLMGVLVESSFLGDKLEYSIAGVGLNVYNRVRNAEYPAISLSELIDDFHLSLNDLLELLFKDWVNPMD